ncbi:MAG: DNA repair exonuclease [Nannocystis sp.]|uniref:metallophosphoesterase family protein n=1 Tax=Nannocystis sp. TaxID=1962667 RepID=UPI002423D435|nr:DNA repair exonuclease [Nannocystis sp.]MBK9753114.1 DNA repair exonuclease [Nannocystis sp.]
MITVVHAADLHIDSPLRGLGRLEGAPVDDLRLATRRAFVRLIDTCLEEQAALLILAGDVFDGEWRDFNTGLFFVRELGRLRDVGTQVAMVRGNHDAESVISRHIPLPEHVFSFSVDAPESRDYPRLGLAVHGQSYGVRSVDDNLAAAYPARRRDLFNLGVLHTNAVASSEHGNYAPCTVAQLVRHGYDYWALGHVHRAQVLHRDPWVVYPGNLQGRHAHESGAKGCTLLRLDGLRLDRVESREVDVLRWAELVVSADAARDMDDLLAQIRVRMQAALADASGRPVLARITVEGTTPLHAALAADPTAVQGQVRALAAELGELWPEKIRFVTRPPLGEPGELNDLFQTLRDELRLLAEDPAALARYSEGLAPLVTAAAPLLGHRPDEPARLVARLGELEALLLARLGAAPPVPKASSPQTHAAPVAWSEGAVSHEV